jgi:Kdo2-lipid IVA lauroyltransferase/acyltransferase
MRLLTPDRHGVHDALTLLRANGTVAIFPDEARRGKTMAPLFGRPPHDRGNLAIVAKLARRTGSQIIVTYSRRIEGARFQLRFEAPVSLPASSKGLLDDIAFLNAQIEPVILRNLDQWYYLDDSIEEIE